MRVRVTRLRVSLVVLAVKPYSFLVFHPHYGNMAPRTRPDTLQPIVLLRRRRAQDHAERRGEAHHSSLVALWRKEKLTDGGIYSC